MLRINSKRKQYKHLLLVFINIMYSCFSCFFFIFFHFSNSHKGFSAMITPLLIHLSISSSLRNTLKCCCYKLINFNISQWAAHSIHALFFWPFSIFSAQKECSCVDNCSEHCNNAPTETTDTNTGENENDNNICGTSIEIPSSDSNNNPERYRIVFVLWLFFC